MCKEVDVWNIQLFGDLCRILVYKNVLYLNQGGCLVISLITVENSKSADYSVFNSAGQLISSGNFTGKATISVFASGVFIVNVCSDSVQDAESVVVN